jgi:hypothetical protein
MMAPPRSQVQGEVVVVEPLNLELLSGLNGLNIAKRLNVLNRRRGTGVALRGKDSSEPIRLSGKRGGAGRSFDRISSKQETRKIET